MLDKKPTEVQISNHCYFCNIKLKQALSTIMHIPNNFLPKVRNSIIAFELSYSPAGHNEHHCSLRSYC